MARRTKPACVDLITKTAHRSGARTEGLILEATLCLSLKPLGQSRDKLPGTSRQRPAKRGEMSPRGREQARRMTCPGICAGGGQPGDPWTLLTWWNRTVVRKSAARPGNARSSNESAGREAGRDLEPPVAPMT